jgi:ribosomal protein S18 acetylase RimI-like enzyme
MSRLFLFGFLSLWQGVLCFLPSIQKHQASPIYPTDTGRDEIWKARMFFAEEPPSKNQKKSCQSTPQTESSESADSSSAIELVISDSEGFLNAAGSFLVDSFWLGSDHHKLGENIKISDDVRMRLVVEQCADLQEKYGKRMGKRLARACVVGALDEETKELIGIATLKETLLVKNDILEPEKAEVIAKNSVAILGPKQRRQYKDASIITITTELLSPCTKAVCVLSNLAVSRKARRRGVGQRLCEEVEALANDWGYKEVHLLVESNNAVARSLYEQKLGYRKVELNKDAPALRVDIEKGNFLEKTADTLILTKQL